MACSPDVEARRCFVFSHPSGKERRQLVGNWLIMLVLFFLIVGKLLLCQCQVPVRCPRGKRRRGRDQKAHFADVRWESDL